MKMKNEEKNEKEFNIETFIIITCIILYFVIRIGDIISISNIIDNSIFRYTAVGIASIIVTFILVLVIARKNSNYNFNDSIKRFMIAPLIVSVIIGVYGICSVYSNLGKLKKNYMYSAYSTILKDEVRELEKKATSDAISNWMITALIYLISSELVMVLLKNRVKISEDDHSANLSNLANMQNQVVQGSMNYNSTNDNEKNNTDSTTRNIKWDL